LKVNRKHIKHFLPIKQKRKKETYKIISNETKRIVRKAHQESWGRFISKIANDVHGGQILAYKTVRKLNNSVRESVHLNCIEEEE
jgi:hypothetical protein